MTHNEELARERAEDQYYTAAANLDTLLGNLPPEQVRNLMRQYLVGVFDIGILESLTPEQANGVTLWIEDLIITAAHLDLNEEIEPGDAVTWS